jgi:hypothetical protein
VERLVEYVELSVENFQRPDRRWISNLVQGSGEFRGKRSEPAVKPDESG